MALTQNSPSEMLTGINKQIIPEKAFEETEALKEKDPVPTMNSVINSDSEAELFLSAIQGSNNTKTKHTHGESGRINQDKSIASEAALENISQLLQTIPESPPYDPFEFMLNAPTSPYETLRTGTTQYEHIFTESRQSPDNDNENNSLVSEATEVNPLSTQMLDENLNKYPMDSPQKTPEASSKLPTNSLNTPMKSPQTKLEANSKTYRTGANRSTLVNTLVDENTQTSRLCEELRSFETVTPSKDISKNVPMYDSPNRSIKSIRRARLLEERKKSK